MAGVSPSPGTPSVDVENSIAKKPSLDDDATITLDLEAGGCTDPEEKRPVTEDEDDPNIVSWDGPDDPQNPKNWRDSKKWFNIAVLSILTIIT